MSSGPFLNIKVSKGLMDRLDDYRFATRRPSRAEAAREPVDRALNTLLAASGPEPARPGDPDCPGALPATGADWRPANP